MRSIITAALTTLVLLSPETAQGQTRTGRFQWAGAGDAFTWYWRKSTTSATRATRAGAAFKGQFRYDAAAAEGEPWPEGAIGGTAFGPSVDVYCVDFLHTVKKGYDAYFTKLDGPLTNTRSSDVVRYMKAAWLSTKLNDFSTATHLGRRTRADIHAAIWNVMSGLPIRVYDGSGSTTDPVNFGVYGRMDWVQQANANYESINASEWTVVTDRCVTTTGNAGDGMVATDNCSQEFLTHNVVPEPATMILLGTGLLATLMMAGVMRRPDA